MNRLLHNHKMFEFATVWWYNVDDTVNVYIKFYLGVTEYMKSNFTSDVKDSEKVGKFLDDYFYDYYKKHSEFAEFERVHNRYIDFKGADVIGTTKSGEKINIDEKATASYMKKQILLPTFAFELGGILEHNKDYRGWLLNPEKDTQLYVLAWPIEIDGEIALSEVMVIDRDLLLSMLAKEGLTGKILSEYTDKVYQGDFNGFDFYPEKGTYYKKIDENFKLVYSTKIAEKPFNLVIGKEFLAQVAGEIFWICNDKGISPVRISSERYFPPANWKRIYSFLHKKG